MITIEEVKRINDRLEELGIDASKVTITKDGEINVDGDVDIDGEEFPDGKIDIKFNEIKGNFIMTDCNVKTLENGPKKVDGSFTVNNCSLESLEGCPESVGEFNVVGCDFVDEDDIPEECEITGVEENEDGNEDEDDFASRFHAIDGQDEEYPEEDEDGYCAKVDITNNNGVYEINIVCDGELRTSDGVGLQFDAEGLTEIPEKFITSEPLQIINADSLTSLKNVPETLPSFQLFGANLKDFTGDLKKVDDYVYLSECEFESLENIPEIGGDFTYSDCIIKNVDGAKEKVKGEIKEY